MPTADGLPRMACRISAASMVEMPIDYPVAVSLQPLALLWSGARSVFAKVGRPLRLAGALTAAALAGLGCLPTPGKIEDYY